MKRGLTGAKPEAFCRWVMDVLGWKHGDTFTDLFPGRTEVPKTLIFARDDSHADDIVQIVREEFDRGNQFAQKITYKTTGSRPEQLIQDFRNSYDRVYS